MADKKISIMTELAVEPAAGDLFTIVDISEAVALYQRDFLKIGKKFKEGTISK